MSQDWQTHMKLERNYQGLLSKPEKMLSLKSKNLIYERDVLTFTGNERVAAFEIFPAKSFKSSSGKNNNLLIMLVLENGEVLIKNTLGNQLIRFQSNMTDVIDIAAPTSFDEQFFALLDKQGNLKVFNYTIIDN